MNNQADLITDNHLYFITIFPILLILGLINIDNNNNNNNNNTKELLNYHLWGPFIETKIPLVSGKSWSWGHIIGNYLSQCTLR